MKFLVLKLSVLVACILYSSEALECYQCEGERGGDCAKGLASVMNVVDCPDGPDPLNVAMCLQRDMRTGSTYKFWRGCTKWSNPSYCVLMYRLATQNSFAMRVYSCNQCSEPKCNTQQT